LAIAASRDNQTTSPPKPGIEALQSLVSADLRLVNEEILRRMDSHVAMIPQVARHIIAAGGKRVRPMLTLAAAQMCGYGGSGHILLAACVEFIHTATLLHDDVVDESDKRRGLPTANAAFGNQAPVLVGDFLFARAFQLMVETNSLEILRILANAAAVICEGEVLQLTTTNDVQTAEETYLQVIAAKTAALFSAACRVGAVIADRPLAEAEALDAFGYNLGIAFQLIDDALDYGSAGDQIGKNLGDDFKEGKATLPILLAFAQGNEEEQAFWRRTIETLDQQDGDFDRAKALIAARGTLDATIARAEAYGAKALAALDSFGASPTRDALAELVAFCLARRF
jgi:octaprenyl-diphosphate synthase